MELKKRKRVILAFLGLYIFAVVEIILVKHPRFFLYRMKETFYRHHFNEIGLYANFRPFHFIWYVTVHDFHLGFWILNIIGNIVLFIPAGVLIPFYLEQPYKGLKTVLICFLLSTCFETFQLITACGFADVDDILLNSAGGAIGMYLYKLFIKHSNYTQKKLVVTHAPSLIEQS